MLSEHPGCWNKPLTTGGYLAPDREYNRWGYYHTRTVVIRTEWADRKCDRAEGKRCEGCTK